MTDVMLAPTPKYISRKLNGQPNIGGRVYTYVTLTTTPKETYQDPAGSISNGNYFDLDGQGEANVYWRRGANELYTIKEYELNNGVYTLINTQDNYPVVGSNTTTTINNSQTNVVRNAQFSFWSFGTTFTIGTGNTGSQDDNDFICDDWLYKRDDTTYTVTMTADAVSLNDTSTIDGNPIYLFKFASSGTVAGTYSKFYQRYDKVQTFAGRNVSFAISGKSTTNSVINIYAVQNFGTLGSPSAEVKKLLKQITLTPTLTRYTSENVAIPSVGGKTLGTNNDDALLLQVEFPVDATATVWLGNAQFSQSTTISTFPVEVYTQQELELQSKVINALPITADVKPTFKTTADAGWLMMNDQTIGNPASAATSKGVALRELYKKIWDGVTDTYAPVVGGRGANAYADFDAAKPMYLTKTLGRVVASAGQSVVATTFTVNFGTSTSNLIVASTASPSYYTAVPVVLTTTGTLPTGLSLATTYYVIQVDATTIKLGSTAANAINGTPVTFSDNGTGVHTVTITYTNWALGQFIGEENHGLIIAEMPAHNHTGSTAVFNSGSNYTAPRTPFVLHNDVDSGTVVSHPLTITSQGGSAVHNNMQPTTFMRFMIRI